MVTAMSEPNPNVEKVATALTALGEAYRGDWSDFDGRSLRSQLEELAGYLTSERLFDLDRWYVASNICPDSRSWAEHCGQRSVGVGIYWCDHLEALARPSVWESEELRDG